MAKAEGLRAAHEKEAVIGDEKNETRERAARAKAELKAAKRAAAASAAPRRSCLSARAARGSPPR